MSPVQTSGGVLDWLNDESKKRQMSRTDPTNERPDGPYKQHKEQRRHEIDCQRDLEQSVSAVRRRGGSAGLVDHERRTVWTGSRGQADRRELKDPHDFPSCQSLRKSYPSWHLRLTEPSKNLMPTRILAGEIGIAGMSHAWSPGRLIGRNAQSTTGLPDGAVLCSTCLRSPQQVYLPFKQSES